MRISSASLVAMVTLVALGGCVPRASRDSYDQCFVTSDCGNTSDRCLDVINGSSRDSMCSSTCFGPSDFCPRDWMGVEGDCRDIGSGSFNCYQACRTNSDCLGPFTCQVPGVGGASICLPGRGSSGPVLVGAYELCSPSAATECDSSTDGCATVRNGGVATDFCTNNCLTDNDCPRDIRGGRGACFDLEGSGEGICFERCNTSDDCTFNAGCTDRTASGAIIPVPICLP